MSALANEVDDLRGVNQMHAWGIARDLDLLAVAAVETAGTAAVLTDLEEQVREAILAVAAATYSDESQQVVVGTPADLAMLVAPRRPTQVTWGRCRPVQGREDHPTTAATAEQVTVFAPGSFRVSRRRCGPRR